MERDPSFSLMDVNSPQITFTFNSFPKRILHVFFSWLYISEKRRSRITNTMMQKRTRLWLWLKSQIITKSAKHHVVWGQDTMTRWTASNGNPRNLETTRGGVWSKVDYFTRNAETMACGEDETKCLFPPFCQYQLQLKLLPKCKRERLTLLEKNEEDFCDSSVRKDFLHSKSKDHLENIILSETRQAGKDKIPHMISLTCGI